MVFTWINFIQINLLLVSENDLAESFAGFFEAKVNDLISNANINPTVCNGVRKMTVNNENFMSIENVKKP